MARPRKYKTEEERREARREAVRRCRAKKQRSQPLPPPVHDPQPVTLIGEPNTGVPDLEHWARKTLIVPTGPLMGQPFTLQPEQSEWIHAALQPGIREAGMSVARKNGKSGAIACVLLAGLVHGGPLNRPQWRGVVTSLTGDLAKELKEAMRLTALASHLGGLEFLRSPTPGSIRGAQGSLLNVLAADKASGHAIGADLVIIDEMGLLQENKRFLVNQLLSCISGRNGQLWGISIKGDGPMFQEIEDRQGDAAVHWKEWTAEANCDLDDREQWHAANPGLRDGIKSLDYMVDACRRAIEVPSNENHFRGHDLNQKLNPDQQTIVSTVQWKGCITTSPPPRVGLPIVGLDVGGSEAMSAATAIWESGRIEVYAAFPGLPDLKVRGSNDGVGNLYVQMHQAGFLQEYSGCQTVPMTIWLPDVLATIGSARIIIADTFKKADVLQALSEAGLNLPILFRGGTSAGAENAADIRAFQALVITRFFQTTPQPVLEFAISQSNIKTNLDPKNPLKLEKARARSRIDTLSATVVASSMARKLFCSHTPESSGLVVAARA